LRSIWAVLTIASILILGPIGFSQEIEAQSLDLIHTEHKISKIAGNFNPNFLNTQPFFGESVASLGDLDGDSVTDFAVGGIFGVIPLTTDVDGVVWILLMNSDGTVKSSNKITEGIGGFGGTLDSVSRFGSSLANIGDLDGDGVVDLAVGNEGDSSPDGAVWILFMNSDGTVKSEQKILHPQGGNFGNSLANIGDLDGDGVIDLAVGAEDAHPFRGSAWILFMNSDGTVKSEIEIILTQGSIVLISSRFGSSVAPLGDLDGDGVLDLAVGAYQDDDGDTNAGAIWILFLDTDGTVKSEQKISQTQGGFGGSLGNRAAFGHSITNMGDLNGDGIIDLIVGAPHVENTPSIDGGKIWVLYMNTDGTVKSEQEISDSAGGFNGALLDIAFFGESVNNVGDFDGDGVNDVLVGSPGDQDDVVPPDEFSGPGAIWLLLLNELCVPPPSGPWVITLSCTLSTSSIAPDDVMVKSGAVLTIPNLVTLDINFATKNLTVQAEGGVLIESGGKIT